MVALLSYALLLSQALLLASASPMPPQHTSLLPYGTCQHKETEHLPDPVLGPPFVKHLSARQQRIPTVCTIEAIETLLFQYSLQEFLRYRTTQADRIICLDWTHNGCSKVPDAPLGFNFLPACIRHDFAFRNFRDRGVLKQYTERVDEVFLQDLFKLCESEWNVALCRKTASAYHAGMLKMRPIVKGG